MEIKEVNKADAKNLSYVEVHLSILQQFIDNNIKGSNCMTAAAVYAAFSKQYNISSVGENDFINGFRTAVKLGKLTGIEGAKRAGYRRIGTAPLKPAQASKDESSSEESEDSEDSLVGKTEIIIDSTHKIVGQDRYNWVYMVCNASSNWHVEAYFGTTRQMLRGITDKLFSDALKQEGGNIQLGSLESVFLKIQDRLISALEKAVK
jgi:hypothetical protein